MTKTFAIVPAAGTGSRLGGDVPKQYLEIGGRSLLEWALAPLLAKPWIDEVIVAVAPGESLDRGGVGGNQRLRVLAIGGATRRDTVLNAIRLLAGGDDDWVLVHDAARPGLDPAALERLREALAASQVGGLLALPVADTIKRARPGSGAAPAVVATVARNDMWLAQTPQMFRLGLLRDALAAAPQATDEAAAVEALGHCPLLVPGSPRNFKVTTSDDLAAMCQLLDKGERMGVRIGEGYDVHALVPGRELVIGGVRIEFDRGMLGHSDADVLLHAIVDALLGAAGLGDIGSHFPDSDPSYRGMASSELLRRTGSLVRAAGYQVGNVDATVIAQEPRLGKHIPAMIRAIAAVLAIDPGRLSIKAKSGERLGFVGRGEGIEARAVALLETAER